MRRHTFANGARRRWLDIVPRCAPGQAGWRRRSIAASGAMIASTSFASPTVLPSPVSRMSGPRIAVISLSVEAEAASGLARGASIAKGKGGRGALAVVDQKQTSRRFDDVRLTPIVRRSILPLMIQRCLGRAVPVNGICSGQAGDSPHAGSSPRRALARERHLTDFDHRFGSSQCNRNPWSGRSRHSWHCLPFRL